MYVLKNGDSSHILEENYKNMFLRKTPAGRLWQDEIFYSGVEVANQKSRECVTNAQNHVTESAAENKKSEW